MLATRPKGTGGNDKFKLSLTPAFQVNIIKCHDTPSVYVCFCAIKRVDHVPCYLSELLRALLRSDNLSRNSCKQESMSRVE